MCLSTHGAWLRSVEVPPSPTATAGVFCTYPQPFLTKRGQFFSEFITATLLMFVIFALKDESNRGAMGKTGAGPFFRRSSLEPRFWGVDDSLYHIALALFFLIFGLGGR